MPSGGQVNVADPELHRYAGRSAQCARSAKAGADVDNNSVLWGHRGPYSPKSLIFFTLRTQRTLSHPWELKSGQFWLLNGFSVRIICGITVIRRNNGFPVREVRAKSLTRRVLIPGHPRLPFTILHILQLSSLCKVRKPKLLYKRQFSRIYQASERIIPAFYTTILANTTISMNRSCNLCSIS